MPLNINKDIAKDVHKDKVRHARKPLFQKLDVEFQIAIEKGEDLKPIAEKKQKLRDAPQDSKIDEIEDVEELKELWDEELLGNSPYSKSEVKEPKVEEPIEEVPSE